jgi:hypothetical protein
MTDARALHAARTVTRAASLVLGLLAWLAGCGSDLPTGLQCVPGRVLECACPGGGNGYQSCAADGAYTAYTDCFCFGGGAAAGGSGGAGGTGGSGSEYVTPGTTCQILGATASCDCGDTAGKAGCFSYETGPAWSTCRCPEWPQGGTGGAAGAAGAAGSAGSAGSAGAAGAAGSAGSGGTGGAGTGGAGGTGGAATGGTGGVGSTSCPGSFQCLFGICTDTAGSLPGCTTPGASCMGTGTCVQNGGAGGVNMLVCYIQCTP